MTKTDINKKAMIEALEASLGIVTTACKKVGISRETHYKWLREDEAYSAAVSDLENVALDFAESKLHSQIKRKRYGYYLLPKNQGKKRGYVERQEIAHEGIQTFTIEEVDGEDSSQ